METPLEIASNSHVPSYPTSPAADSLGPPSYWLPHKAQKQEWLGGNRNKNGNGNTGKCETPEAAFPRGAPDFGFQGIVA